MEKSAQDKQELQNMVRYCKDNPNGLVLWERMLVAAAEQMLTSNDSLPGDMFDEFLRVYANAKAGRRTDEQIRGYCREAASVFADIVASIHEQCEKDKETGESIVTNKEMMQDIARYVSLHETMLRLSVHYGRIVH